MLSNDVFTSNKIDHSFCEELEAASVYAGEMHVVKILFSIIGLFLSPCISQIYIIYLKMCSGPIIAFHPNCLFVKGRGESDIESTHYAV